MNELKYRLKEYLILRGITVLDRTSNNVRCPNPSHPDEHPTATLYQKGKASPFPRVACPVCDKSWNIFDIAGMLDGLSEFKDQLASVKKTFGIVDEKKSVPVSLPIEEARKIYNSEFIDKCAARNGWGERVGSWKYLDLDGNVVALDIRFENNGKKTTLTYWYDGKTIKWSKPPVLIYGLERLEKGKPVLLHEGAKCADIGHNNLSNWFSNISWSGGAAKSKLINWSIIKDYEVFIMADNDEPGMKAAIDIQNKIKHAKIITPPTKGKGDDIEQYLQELSIEDLTAYILNPENHYKKDCDVYPSSTAPENTPPKTTTPLSEDGSFSESFLPFKILGIGDDGKANFITEAGRHVAYSLESISKEKLRVLASKTYWTLHYREDGKTDWDSAIDDIIRLSEKKDFSISILRGRGAWNDSGKICYNDGMKVYGEPDDKKIYLKLPRQYIGIDHNPVSASTLKKITEIMFSLSFETKTDAVRVMGWTVIAPFCGALEYRPTLFLTGGSSSGKSKVQKLFIEKISCFKHADMRTSTEAGIRRMIDKDARVVFFDEAGKESEKMKINFDFILAFIRSNYSDDSPEGFKANMKETGYVTYKMNSMFGLATTDPTIDNVQDENRILRVNFVKPKHTAEEWQKIENSLIETLDEETCHGIRSLTWSRLRLIISLAKKIVQIARNKTNRDYRSSLADMLLAAAYMVVWCDTPEPTSEQIENMLEKFYTYQQMDENRNEAEEFIDRVLDEIIDVVHKDRREKITLREMISRVYWGHVDVDGELESLEPGILKEYRRYLSMYGLKMLSHGNVHFVHNNHMIRKITGLGAGYHKLLMRHPGYEKYDNPVSYNGKSQRGSVITGLVKKKSEDMSDEEKLDKVLMG